MHPEIPLHSRIDLLSSERRPDRYIPGQTDGWMYEVAAEIAPFIPLQEARTRQALSEVRNREKRHLRETNKMLRACAEQLPLDWELFMNSVLAVGIERVKCGAAKAADFLQFAREERMRAKHDVAARMGAVKGATRLANAMKARRLETAASLTDALLEEAAS